MMNANAVCCSDDSGDEFFDARESLATNFTLLSDSYGRKEDDDLSVETLQLIDVVSPSERPSIIEHSDFVAPVTNGLKKRRTTIPQKPQHGLAIWALLKNCIGKDLSRIAMPVNFNEPLSMLQRLSEDFEYSNLLDKAARLNDSLEQMCYVAAFAVTAWTNSAIRANKPFNPLLNETYECDRTHDFGWRIFAEQVSHHPPVCALNAHGANWIAHEDFGYLSKFRATNMKLSCDPGYTHIILTDQRGQAIHYSWEKCPIKTTIHGVLIGPLWLEHHGEMSITNHATGDKCLIKFHGSSKHNVPRQVTGKVYDNSGIIRRKLQGTWDVYMEAAEVLESANDQEYLGSWRSIWNVNPPYYTCDADKYYNFTKLAVELNEMEEGIACTDSRLRPDQRLMEQAKWDEANVEKVRLEEKQRTTARLRKDRKIEEHQPIWFKKSRDQTSGVVMWRLSSDYWKCKKEGKWPKCPDIF